MSTSPWIPRLNDPRDAVKHFRFSIQDHDLGTPTVLVVCCDVDARPVMHLHLVGCVLESTPTECADVMDALLERLEGEQHPPYSGLAIGLTRPGGEHVQPYDRAWFKAFFRVCHRRALEAHGVYVVGRAGARAVQFDDAA
jgi:hypothetical protein